MTAGMTADEICRLLDLAPNATCGSVRVTFTSPLAVAPGGLPAPFADGRPLGSALYFLVTPAAPVRLHRIRNDQLYHYYLGDPLEVFMLHGDGSSERSVVGPDLRGGQRVQLHIPGATFHTARVMGEGRWFLGGSTEWPGVIPPDVEIGDIDEMARSHPDVAAEVRAIAASARQAARRGRPAVAVLRRSGALLGGLAAQFKPMPWQAPQPIPWQVGQAAESARTRDNGRRSRR